MNLETILLKCSAIVYKNECKPDDEFVILKITDPTPNEWRILRETVEKINLPVKTLVWRDSISDVQSMSRQEAEVLRDALTVIINDGVEHPAPYPPTPYKSSAGRDNHA